MHKNSSNLFFALFFLINKISAMPLDKVDTTVGIFMAARNDLFPFVARNIKQMKNIGSNERLKLIAHLDMIKDKNRISKRLLIEKNKILQIGRDFSCDSGDVNTFVDFAEFTIKNFPSEKIVLELWNHGSGILDPVINKSINPAELFKFNPVTKKIKLNRRVGYINYLNSKSNVTKNKRGICFDDTTSNYLSTKKLQEGLKTISTKFLGNKKIDILLCDACLMAMIEVASAIKDSVDIFVASQEVELAPGYEYDRVFSQYNDYAPSKSDFAKHIVQSFAEFYKKITDDYTHSAIDLSKISVLEKNVSEVASLLIHGLENQLNNSVKEAIKLSKQKGNCTHFHEPTYLDLGHLYKNLLSNLSKFILNSERDTVEFKYDLKNLLQHGLNLIEDAVIANVYGKNLKFACGISIYFPETRIHNSYYNSEFANNTKWLNFLEKYVGRSRKK